MLAEEAFDDAKLVELTAFGADEAPLLRLLMGGEDTTGECSTWRSFGFSAGTSSKNLLFFGGGSWDSDKSIVGQLTIMVSVKLQISLEVFQPMEVG
jgi:hypothetical protein